MAGNNFFNQRQGNFEPWMGRSNVQQEVFNPWMDSGGNGPIRRDLAQSNQDRAGVGMLEQSGPQQSNWFREQNMRGKRPANFSSPVYNHPTGMNSNTGPMRGVSAPLFKKVRHGMDTQPNPDSIYFKNEMQEGLQRQAHEKDLKSLNVNVGNNFGNFAQKPLDMGWGNKERDSRGMQARDFNFDFSDKGRQETSVSTIPTWNKPVPAGAERTIGAALSPKKKKKLNKKVIAGSNWNGPGNNMQSRADPFNMNFSQAGQEDKNPSSSSGGELYTRRPRRTEEISLIDEEVDLKWSETSNDKKALSNMDIYRIRMNLQSGSSKPQPNRRNEDDGGFLGDSAFGEKPVRSILRNKSAQEEHDEAMKASSKRSSGMDDLYFVDKSTHSKTHTQQRPSSADRTDSFWENVAKRTEERVEHKPEVQKQTSSIGDLLVETLLKHMTEKVDANKDRESSGSNDMAQKLLNLLSSNTSAEARPKEDSKEMKKIDVQTSFESKSHPDVNRSTNQDSDSRMYQLNPIPRPEPLMTAAPSFPPAPRNDYNFPPAPGNQYPMFNQHPPPMQPSNPPDFQYGRYFDQPVVPQTVPFTPQPVPPPTMPQPVPPPSIMPPFQTRPLMQPMFPNFPPMQPIAPRFISPPQMQVQTPNSGTRWGPQIQKVNTRGRAILTPIPAKVDNGPNVVPTTAISHGRPGAPSLSKASSAPVRTGIATAKPSSISKVVSSSSKSASSSSKDSSSKAVSPSSHLFKRPSIPFTIVPKTVEDRVKLLDQETQLRKKVNLLIVEVGRLRTKCKNLIRNISEKDQATDSRLVSTRKLQVEIKRQIDRANDKLISISKALKDSEHLKEDVPKSRTPPKTGSKKSSSTSSSTKSGPIVLNLKPPKKEVMADSKPGSSSTAVTVTKQYRFTDSGDHWCKHCDVIFTVANDLLKHLQRRHYDIMERIPPHERPWAEKPSESRLAPGEQFTFLPFRGVEFMSPCDSFYCNLCKELFGDIHSARNHLESLKHNANYSKFCKGNPQYVKRIQEVLNAQKKHDKDKKPKDVKVEKKPPASKHSSSNSNSDKRKEDEPEVIEIDDDDANGAETANGKKAVSTKEEKSETVGDELKESSNKEETSEESKEKTSKDIAAKATDDSTAELPEKPTSGENDAGDVKGQDISEKQAEGVVENDESTSNKRAENIGSEKSEMYDPFEMVSDVDENDEEQENVFDMITDDEVNDEDDEDILADNEDAETAKQGVTTGEDNREDNSKAGVADVDGTNLADEDMAEVDKEDETEVVDEGEDEVAKENENEAEVTNEEGTEVFDEEGTEVGNEEGAEVGDDEGAEVIDDEGAEFADEEGAEETEVVNEEGADAADEEGAEVVDEEGAEVVDEDGAEITDEDGAEVVDEEGAEVADEEGAEVIDEDGDEVADEEGAEVVSSDEEGAEVIDGGDEEGDKVIDDEEAKVADEEGDEVVDDVGAEVADEKGSEVVDEEGAEVADEEESEVEDRAEVADEKRSEVADKEGAEVADEEGADVADEEGADVADKEGAEVEDEEGTDVADKEGAEVEDEEGAEVEDEEGAEGIEASENKDATADNAEIDDVVPESATEKMDQDDSIEDDKENAAAGKDVEDTDNGENVDKPDEDKADIVDENKNLTEEVPASDAKTTEQDVVDGQKDSKEDSENSNNASLNAVTVTKMESESPPSKRRQVALCSRGRGRGIARGGRATAAMQKVVPARPGTRSSTMGVATSASVEMRTRRQRAKAKVGISVKRDKDGNVIDSNEAMENSVIDLEDSLEKTETAVQSSPEIVEVTLSDDKPIARASRGRGRRKVTPKRADLLAKEKKSQDAKDDEEKVGDQSEKSWKISEVVSLGSEETKNMNWSAGDTSKTDSEGMLTDALLEDDSDHAPGNVMEEDDVKMEALLLEDPVATTPEAEEDDETCLESDYEVLDEIQENE